MERRTIIADRRFHEEESDKGAGGEFGWSDFAGTDLSGNQLRSWSFIRWTAILSASLGIGWLVYETIATNAAMLH
jgi:hypothetical protein